MSTTRRGRRLYRTGTTQQLTPSRRVSVRGGPHGEIIVLPAHRLDGHYAARWPELYSVTLPRRTSTSGPATYQTLVDAARTHFTHTAAGS